MQKITYDEWSKIKYQNIYEYPTRMAHRRIDLELSNPVDSSGQLFSCYGPDPWWSGAVLPNSKGTGPVLISGVSMVGRGRTATTVDIFPECPSCCKRRSFFDSDTIDYFDLKWSVIFNVYEISNTPHNSTTLRMLVEKDHCNPWGERIILMSISEDIYRHETHSGCFIDFAFFRGKYWNITWNQPYFSDHPGDWNDIF